MKNFDIEDHIEGGFKGLFERAKHMVHEAFMGILFFGFLAISAYVTYLFTIGATKMVLKEAPRDVQVNAYILREVARDLKSQAITGKPRTNDQILRDRINDVVKGEIPNQ